MMPPMNSKQDVQANDTISLLTGGKTQTVGGGSMNLGRSEYSWLVPVLIAVAVLLLWKKKR